MQTTQDCEVIRERAQQLHDEMKKTFPESVHQAVAQLSALVADLADHVKTLENRLTQLSNSRQ